MGGEGSLGDADARRGGFHGQPILRDAAGHGGSLQGLEDDGGGDAQDRGDPAVGQQRREAEAVDRGAGVGPGGGGVVEEHLPFAAGQRRVGEIKGRSGGRVAAELLAVVDDRVDHRGVGRLGGELPGDGGALLVGQLVFDVGQDQLGVQGWVHAGVEGAGVVWGEGWVRASRSLRRARKRRLLTVPTGQSRASPIWA